MDKTNLHNNFERAVIGKDDPISPREGARYEWAQKHMVGDTILDIGCSSGWGVRYFGRDGYLGVDYDEQIIQYAKDNFGPKFVCADINTFDIGRFDTIVAFEVLEHLDNGRELAQRLKGHCRKLLISVPYNEPPGFWGVHHKLHHLTPEDFPGFRVSFMGEDGQISDKPFAGPINLMLLEWEPYLEVGTKPLSIVIPTYNRLDLLRPLVEDIRKYTAEYELIVVSNGCHDGTREWLSEQPDITCFTSPEPLGFAGAVNKGIALSHGERIILLNNDTRLLEQSRDKWVEMLSAPFVQQSGVAVTGPSQITDPNSGWPFIIFYCAMLSREVIRRIGLLDEIFNPGGGEDTDWCIRAQKAGYTICQVPDPNPIQIPASGVPTGHFPIYHEGEQTVGKLPHWPTIFERNSQILRDRYHKPPHVLAEVCTRGRYLTTLPMVLMGIISQTRKPDRLLIVDDGDFGDLRTHPVYRHIFALLDHKGIGWEVVATGGQGQVVGHQLAQERAIELVWRVDDDSIPEPDCLAQLLAEMGPDVGAVGGLILTPPVMDTPTAMSTEIEDALILPHPQWFALTGKLLVEHLHCSFLYRRGVAKYSTELSVVGHTEETQFTYEIHRAGYRVVVTPKAVTWHLRNPEGGIRSHDNPELWKSDRAVFDRKLAEWKGRAHSTPKVILLDNGLGDHLAFSNIVPDLVTKHGRLVIGCVYPEVFASYPEVTTVPVAMAAQMVNPDDHNIYRWMGENHWTGHIIHAFQVMHGLL